MRSLTSRTSASTLRLPSGLSGLGGGRHFDPHGTLVGATEAEQVVAHGAVCPEPFDERHARQRINEAVGLEGANFRLRRFACVTKNEFYVGIGSDRRRRIGADHSDVDALVDSLEEPCERRSALIHGEL